MHTHYGHTDAIAKLDRDSLTQLLKFRIDFLEEELTELKDAFAGKTHNGAEDTVDALIDLIVVAIGTLDAFNVNAHLAWEEVLKANMSKEAGVNPSRPNPLGLPDLVKPEGWRAPSHEYNHGRLSEVFDEQLSGVPAVAEIVNKSPCEV